MIRVENLYKVFGEDPKSVLPMVRAGRSKDDIKAETGHVVGVDDVSLELERGEFFVIMGLSGSGKSTLLRCLNRLIEPTAGKVYLRGDDGEIDVTALDENELRQVRKRQLSMVFQRFSLFPHRDVLSNVAYGPEIQGLPKEERERLGQEMLELVGLGAWGASYPAELSGGMQQRVGLARALATRADVLLMDEPFSALDPLIKVTMQDEMLNIQQKLHRTIVFITHDLDEALKLGDRIAIMESGRIVQLGTPEDIIVNPKTEYVADFVEHADPTGVITAATIALPLEHERIERVRREAGLDHYAHRARPNILFGVRDGRLEEVVVDGKRVELRSLPEVLATPATETRRADLVLRVSEDSTLRQALRGRTYSSLPAVVEGADGRLKGVLTERELIQGILEKRGHQATETTDEIHASAPAAS